MPVAVEIWRRSGGPHSATTRPSGFTSAFADRNEPQTLLPTPTNETFLNAVYEDILGRPIDPSGLAGFEASLTAGATRTQVAYDIVTSTEAYQDLVKSWYEQFLNRIPAPGEGDPFVAQLKAGATEEQVEAILLGSTEFDQEAGGTDAGFVAALYQDVLGRAPSGTESSTWVGAIQALEAGESSTAARTQVALDILTSPEHAADEVQGWFEQFLGRPAAPQDVATYTNLLQNTDDQTVVSSILGSDEFFQKSAAVTDIAPTLTTPMISGMAHVGQTLTATAALPNDSDATVTYQWRESFDGGTSWSNISGATSLSYTIQQSDDGATLQIEATSSDPDGSGTTAASAATRIVLEDVRWAGRISGNFDTGVDWAGGQVPGPLDVPRLAGTRAYTVTVSADHTVSGLLMEASAATLEIANGVSLTIDGSRIRNAGTIAIGTSASSPTALIITNDARLTGGGVIDLGSGSAAIVSSGLPATFVNVDNTLIGAGAVGDASMKLSNKGTIEATGELTVATGGNPIVNTGMLEAVGTGALLRVTSTLDNRATGELAAVAGGEVDVQASVKGGSAVIDGSGSVLDLEGSAGAKTTSRVTFAAGAAGLLNLGNSALFKGTVAGFGAGDSIDVLDVGFAQKRDSYDPGTGILHVSDGTHAANIQLLGSYMAGQFSFQSDMHGGTLITDPSAAASATLAPHA
jgi:hypothetical protein